MWSDASYVFDYTIVSTKVTTYSMKHSTHGELSVVNLHPTKISSAIHLLAVKDPLDVFYCKIEADNSHSCNNFLSKPDYLSETV